MKTFDPAKFQLWYAGHRQDLKYYCDTQRHLVCVPYSIENLHDMAQGLGIKRCWFHPGRLAHYDIPVKRALEIQCSSKVKVVSPKDIVRIIKYAAK